MQPDMAKLAEYLRALGNQNRLELLYALRRPRSVREIELHPQEVRAGENPERAISHQAVRDHLAKLRAIGVLTVERVERDGNVVDEYVLNHQKLFAIVEELRMLGDLRAEEAPPVQPTIGASPAAPAKAEHGPRFVLVRGQGEGRVFALRKENLTAGRGWLIGRKLGLAVSLDYDPFVSSENAEIMLTSAGYRIHDVRSSRNGTLVNFEPVPAGGSKPLAHGDVVSIGRTHLVFRDR
ncbi:MAG TPA: FHA domain-containing protein [Candidatus Thermoplasmatota archaeon]|nr:FHA domain-containing protein [Candidatus Thermoplasmatota archaeon]